VHADRPERLAISETSAGSLANFPCARYFRAISFLASRRDAANDGFTFIPGTIQSSPDNTGIRVRAMILEIYYDAENYDEKETEIERSLGIDVSRVGYS